MLESNNVTKCVENEFIAVLIILIQGDQKMTTHQK